MEEFKTIEDLNPALWEYPFIYKKMPLEKYDEEKEYFFKHLDDYRSGNYIPLWKQRKEAHEKFEFE